MWRGTFLPRQVGNVASHQCIETCVQVGHLVDNIAGTKKLFSDWFQFSETIGDIMDNGGLE